MNGVKAQKGLVAVRSANGRHVRSLLSRTLSRGRNLLVMFLRVLKESCLKKNGEGDLSQEGKDDDRMKCMQTDSVGNPDKVDPSDLLK